MAGLSDIAEGMLIFLGVGLVYLAYCMFLYILKHRILGRRQSTDGQSHLMYSMRRLESAGGHGQRNDAISPDSGTNIRIMNRYLRRAAARGQRSAARREMDRIALGIHRGKIIHSLPLVRYSKAGAHLVSMDMYTKQHMSECPVCLDEYKEAEQVRLLPKCKHVFHPICISSWLASHTTCPLCRTDVPVYKNKKNKSALGRILSSIRRCRRDQILDSSPHDRHSNQHQVTVDVTPSLRQQNNTSDPLFRTSHMFWTGPGVQEEQAAEHPAPSTSSSSLEAGMALSSVRRFHVNVYDVGDSSSSSSWFTHQVSVTTADPNSDEAGSPAGTGFLGVSVDTEL